MIQNPGLLIWPTNQTVVLSVEQPVISLSKKKVRPTSLKIKRRLVNFFHCEGTVHLEIVALAQTVNQYYNHEDLKSLREHVWWECLHGRTQDC